MAEGSGMRRLMLLSVGLILLAVLGVLVYGRLTGSAVPSPVAGVAGGGITARQAFMPATELATQWQEDARLAAASGRWSAMGTRLGGEIEWTFQFFSPSTQRLALIAVTDGTAQMVRESLSPYTVPVLSTKEWRVDSDQALQTWLDRGGRSMVARRPDIDLAMQLHALGEGEGQPVWTVVGSVAGTETAFVVVVNATNGALVEQ